MNKLRKMGVEPNVIDARNAEDSARTYGRGSRVGSALISYGSSGILNAVGDSVITGLANESAAELNPMAILKVPRELLRAESDEEVFIQVRDYVGHVLFEAAQKGHPDAKLHFLGTNSRAGVTSARIYYTAPEACVPRNPEVFDYSVHTTWGFDFSEDISKMEFNVCVFDFSVTSYHQVM